MFEGCIALLLFISIPRTTPEAFSGSSLYCVGTVLNISLITPSAFKRISDVETAVKENA
jgi:hypothetical protein